MVFSVGSVTRSLLSCVYVAVILSRATLLCGSLMCRLKGISLTTPSTVSSFGFTVTKNFEMLRARLPHGSLAQSSTCVALTSVRTVSCMLTPFGQRG